MKEWAYNTSCYPYSDDVTVYDGLNYYCVAESPCEHCGCLIARYEADGDTDGEGHTRDCTTYVCADCGADDIEARWSDRRTVDEVESAIAASMFRGFSQVKALIADAYIGFMSDLSK